MERLKPVINSYGYDPFRADPHPRQEHIEFVLKLYPLARFHVPRTGSYYILAPGEDNRYEGPHADGRANAWKYAAEDLGYSEDN